MYNYNATVIIKNFTIFPDKSWEKLLIFSRTYKQNSRTFHDSKKIQDFFRMWLLQYSLRQRKSILTQWVTLFLRTSKLRLGLSIYATKVVKVFNYKCFVSLSKDFFCSFCSVIKLQKRAFSTLMKVKCTAALYNFEILAILFTSTKKSLKFGFETLRNLVSILI